MADGRPMRLFAGVKVSMAVVGELAAAAETLARRAQQAGVRVRWTAPATYHVTLKYLGWTRPETVGAVGDALRRACAGIPPFSFRTERLGAFPSPGRASVIWAGIDEAAGRAAADGPPGHRAQQSGIAGALAKLAESIEAAVSPLGFEPERRRYHAHVTLGRLRERADVSQVLLPLAEQVFSVTRVAEVLLFESEMKSSGSEYTAVLRIPLETASEAAKRQTAAVQRASSDAPTGSGASTFSRDAGDRDDAGSDDGWGEDPPS